MEDDKNMAIQEKLYTIDDVWELSHRPENENKYYYLIDGELFGICHLEEYTETWPLSLVTA